MAARAITSIVITVPSFLYLVQPQLPSNKKKRAAGHEHGHDAHAADGEHGDVEGEKADTPESEGREDSNESDTSKQDQQSEGSDNGDDSPESGSERDQNTPETSEDESSDDTAHEKEGGGNVEIVQFKGSTNTTEEGVQDDTRKHIPDAKGFAKKRIESSYGNKLGEASTDEQGSENEDLVSVSSQA